MLFLMDRNYTISSWVINLESSRDSMNLQGDKNWNPLKKKIDKMSVFIDNSLKNELPLEVTMCLYSKNKT